MSYESCIHYKFGNTTNYSAIKFQGLEISLSELKMRILNANHMNHSPLQIANAHSKKVYTEDSEMLSRNTSVIVKRIPPPKTNHSSKLIIASQKKRAERDMADRIESSTYDVGNQEANLSQFGASEDSRLKAMIAQASIEFDRGVKQHKDSPTVRCYRCQQFGHQKDKCPLGANSETSRKRPKGIPSNMLEIIPADKVDKDNMREGVYVNRRGDFVIPIVDKLPKAKKLKSSSKSTPSAQQLIPNELLCKLCSNILTDAVVIECCENSFCDECIRTFLINNNFHCPLAECGKDGILPDDLVPNKQLRQSVKLFLANIAKEKYNISQPVSSQSLSPQRQPTEGMIATCGKVEKENSSKATADEVLT